MLGGFDYKYGIQLCANYVGKRNMLEDVMAHEMVHAWDTLRFKTELGPEEDLRKVACSEVSRLFPLDLTWKRALMNTDPGE